MSKLLTRKEAAARLGIGLVTLDEERASGRLGYIQRAPGCKVYIREEDVQAWLARHTHAAIPPVVLTRNTYRNPRGRRVG